MEIITKLLDCQSARYLELKNVFNFHSKTQMHRDFKVRIQYSILNEILKY